MYRLDWSTKWARASTYVCPCNYISVVHYPTRKRKERDIIVTCFNICIVDYLSWSSFQSVDFRIIFYKEKFHYVFPSLLRRSEIKRRVVRIPTNTTWNSDYNIRLWISSDMALYIFEALSLSIYRHMWTYMNIIALCLCTCAFKRGTNYSFHVGNITSKKGLLYIGRGI